MKTYVCEQSLGRIIGSSFKIYIKNLRSLFLIYFLPVFPFAALAQHAQLVNNTWVRIAAYIVSFFMSIFVIPPITVAVSNICLGNKASLMHSYRYVFDKGLGRFLLTYLLLLLAIAIGYILLFVPGIFCSLWFMFALQVAILERVSGRKALKRSKELGKGFYLRNLGVLSVMVIIASVAGTVLAGLFGGIVGLSFGMLAPNMANSQVFILLCSTLGIAASHLLYPIAIIGTVLLYYDMRVRKEAYDNATLAEDLRW